MPLQYNYYVDQGSYTQDPSRRAYSYPSSSVSRETKTDGFQRYPTFSKIFNNRRSYGETSVGTDNGSQQAFVYSQNQNRASKKGVAHKVRFAEQKEVIGQKKKEDVVVEEKNIDAAADGFINWKRRSLQMSRTFKDE